MALKKVYPEDPLKPYVDMSDNQFLNAPFKDMDRYGMSHIEHPDSVFEFILTITGTWPCFSFAYPFPDVAAIQVLHNADGGGRCSIFQQKRIMKV